MYNFIIELVYYKGKYKRMVFFHSKNRDKNTTLNLLEICDRLQGPDRNDRKPTSLAQLLN